MSVTDPTLAVLDACVLIPATLRDTLLRAAAAQLYQPYWSEEILDEVRRNLVNDRLTTPERALRLVDTLRRAFPQAIVAGYDHLIPKLETHPKDRHVLAVAVLMGAGVIVTTNLRHFPAAALDPHGVTAQAPDTFLSDHFAREPILMVRLLLKQAADLRNPPATVEDVLDRLVIHAPHFVQAVRGVLNSPSA